MFTLPFSIMAHLFLSFSEENTHKSFTKKQEIECHKNKK